MGPLMTPKTAIKNENQGFWVSGGWECYLPDDFRLSMQ